jgi:hypothetical protein
MVTLSIVYTPTLGGKPIRVADVDDPELLARVAGRVLENMNNRATRLGMADAGLGLIEEAEARRLREILTTLIPDLDFAGAACA